MKTSRRRVCGNCVFRYTLDGECIVKKKRVGVTREVCEKFTRSKAVVMGVML